MKLKDKIIDFQKLHPTFCEVIRFLIVGGIATIIDYFASALILFSFKPNLYKNFFEVFIGHKRNSNTANVVSTGIGFSVGLIFNYLLSIWFVFIHKGNSKSKKGFTIFTLLSLFGLLINVGGMFFFNGVVGLNYWVTKIILTIIVLIYNYISKKTILFTRKNTINNINKR